MVYCRHATFMSLWLYMYCGSPHIKPVAVGKYCMGCAVCYTHTHVHVCTSCSSCSAQACALQLFVGSSDMYELYAVITI